MEMDMYQVNYKVDYRLKTNATVIERFGEAMVAVENLDHFLRQLMDLAVIESHVPGMYKVVKAIQDINGTVYKIMKKLRREIHRQMHDIYINGE